MKQLTKIIFTLFIITFSISAKAQTYTSYFTGDTSDVQTISQSGICLMGGASENDEAMKWFLNKAAGGDIVVLRVTGADGYNNYLFTDLGISVNSVETIKIPSRAAANDPYVRRQLRNAEAIFIAGGNQFDYLTYWKNTEVDSAINYLITTKKAPIGGLSAGMAIAGDYYFSAAISSITSATALANPYHPSLTLGNSDFIHQSLLANTLCETHFDNPNRKGRLLTFMARMQQGSGFIAKAIACEEYTAVCIDSNGLARVFGDPTQDDFAYFLQTSCTPTNVPELCVANQPLTWNYNKNAVSVYKVKGNTNGNNQVNIVANKFTPIFGGIYQSWYATNGVLSEVNQVIPPTCLTTINEINTKHPLKFFPNPVSDQLIIESTGHTELIIYSLLGEIIESKTCFGTIEIDTKHYPDGIYLLKLNGKNSGQGKFVVKH